MAPIISLPNEILAKIFDYLPPQSLHIVPAACPHWSHVAETLGVCQLDFSRLDHDDEQHAGEEEKMIAHIENEILTEADGASIRHVLILSHRLLPDRVFCFIQRLCPNLISFDYDDHDLFDINTKVNPRRDIQRHSFLSRPWRRTIAHLPACHDGREEWSDDREFAQRLETLYLWHGTFFYACYTGEYYPTVRLPYLPRLNSLTLHHPLRFKEKTICHAHQQCPLLENLTLHDMSLTCLFPREQYYPSNGVEPKLLILKLENVTFLNYDTFHYFPTKYPNIQTLTLSTSYEDYQAFDKHLLALGVRGCIYDMITKFKSLTKLSIHLKGFSKEEYPENPWFIPKVQAYFSQPSNKLIHFEVSYT